MYKENLAVTIISGIISLLILIIQIFENRRIKKIDEDLKRSEGLVELYKKELDDYKKDKQYYQRSVFEKKTELMQAIANSMYSNMSNALEYLRDCGRVGCKINNLDYTTLLQNHDKTVLDGIEFKKLTFSAQVYFKGSLIKIFNEFYDDICEIEKKYKQVIDHFKTYKVSSDVEISNTQLVDKIKNNSIKVMQMFKSEINEKTVIIY